mgnify:CR=1 FL=1
MAILAQRLEEQSPRETSKGYALEELWEVFDAKPDGSVNESGTVDPQAAVGDPGLPKIGDPHPSFGAPFGNPQVTDKVVVRIIANWSVLVRVYYRGWGLYNGGPRNTVASYTTDRRIRLPIWRSVTLPTGPTTVSTFWYQQDPPVLIPRMVIMRVETRFRPGNETTAITEALAANAGTFWFIGTRLYRLSDRSSAMYDGRAFTRANYIFEHEAAIQGIPANSPWGNSAAIPDLAPMQYWSDVGTTTGAPLITSNNPPGYLGGQTPYPPLPGYP